MAFRAKEKNTNFDTKLAFLFDFVFQAESVLFSSGFFRCCTNRCIDL